MKIKDIPYAALRELALEEQYQDLNHKNGDIPIPLAFSWNRSSQGHDFWSYVHNGEYSRARSIFDWGIEPDPETEPVMTSGYSHVIEHIPNFNEQEFLDRCAIAAMQGYSMSGKGNWEERSRWSYKQAKEMLKARKETMR